MAKAGIANAQYLKEETVEYHKLKKIAIAKTFYFA